MKKIILLLFICSFFLVGCSSKSSSGECYEPTNPYNDGGGHDAGFNWAENKGVNSCGGNSQSFIDGCEEYLLQLDEYESCVNK